MLGITRAAVKKLISNLNNTLSNALDTKANISATNTFTARQVFRDVASGTPLDLYGGSVANTTNIRRYDGTVGGSIQYIEQGDSIRLIHRNAIGAADGILNVTAGYSSFNGKRILTSDDAYPTTQYAVGTYVTGRPQNYTNYDVGATVAGTSLYNTPPLAYYLSGVWRGFADEGVTVGGEVLIDTGTWKCISPAYGSGTRGVSGLWLRIE